MGDTKGIGCGVWPVILKNTRFFPACEWHDKAYEEKSWQQENLSRKLVDKHFLKQMLEIAGDSRWHKARARLFYSIARVLGFSFWEGKK